MLDKVRKRARSKGVKFLYFLIAVSFFIGFGIISSVRSCFEGGGAVVAVVNGDIISVRDFSRAFYRELESYQQKAGKALSREDVEKLKSFVLNVLINRRLMVNYAKTLGIEVTDREVANYIASRFNFFDEQGRFDKRRYFMALRQNKISPEEFETQVRDDLFIQKLDEFLKVGLEPTDAEIWLYYKRENESVNLGFVTFNPEDYVKKVRWTRRELKAFYEANIERYQYSKRIVVKYVMFEWKAFKKEVQEPSESDLRKYYEENYEKYSEAFEVVREKVRADLIEERAKEKAFEVASKVRAELKEGKNLDELAPQFGVKVRYTIPFEIPPREDLPGISDDETFAKSFANLNVGEAAPVIELPEGYVVGIVDHVLPEEAVPFEKVVNQVKEDFIAEKAREKAKEAAEKFIEYAHKRGLSKALKRFRLKANETGEFFVDAFVIPGIGDSTELLAAAFTATDREIPFDKPYLVKGTAGERYVVAWVKDRKFANRVEFEKEKERYRDLLLEFKLNLSRTILIFKLRQTGEVKVYPDAMDKIS